MLLTDEEVMDIACQRLSWTDQELIRAIEAAVLAKLREQTPVGEVSAATFVHWKNDQVPKAGTMLFTHPAPSVPEWQPIATAPKDGTRVLIRGDCVVVAGWEEVIGNEGVFGWCIVNDAYIPEHIATHWMPLPKPPMAASRSA